MTCLLEQLCETQKYEFYYNKKQREAVSVHRLEQVGTSQQLVF